MNNLDETIHSPSRLRICAALLATQQVEFIILEQGLRVPKSLLSKQPKMLIDAGYVTLERKPQPFGRSHAWVGFVPVGREAYRSHVAALRKIIEKNRSRSRSSRPVNSPCRNHPAPVG